MLLRYVKISLSFSVAAWGLVAGTMNLIYYTHGPVAAVLSVGGQESARAVSSPVLFALGYAFIYLGKFASGLLASWGTYVLWNNRHDGASFHVSKALSVAACGVGIFMLFFGFYVLAGGFFSPGGTNPLQDAFMAYAFYYIGALGIIALFIASPEFDA